MSRAMRWACSPHDREEPLARLGVVARRTLQRLDEADQARERRPQLVARIGDEIRAHPVGLLDLGHVVERHERAAPAGFRKRGRLDPSREHALHRAGKRELDLAALAAGEDPVDRLVQHRVAHRGDQVAADRDRAEQPLARPVGQHDAPLAVDLQDRQREAFEDRLEHGEARPQPALRRVRLAVRRLVGRERAPPIAMDRRRKPGRKRHPR